MTTEPKNPEAVAPEDVQGYLHTRRAQFAKKKNLADKHGETKVEFVESTGFNKTALGFCERLDRFSPEVRADVLRSLDLIRTAMFGVWGQQEEMDFGGDTRDPAERASQARAGARREVDLLDGPQGSAAFEAAKARIATKNRGKRNGAAPAEIAPDNVNEFIAAEFAKIPDDGEGAAAAAG